jgi:hypothetical protein
MQPSVADRRERPAARFRAAGRRYEGHGPIRTPAPTASSCSPTAAAATSAPTDRTNSGKPSTTATRSPSSTPPNSPDRPSTGYRRSPRTSSYFDTALSSSPASLPTLLAFAEPHRVLFGSGFPFAPSQTGKYFADNLDAVEMERLEPVRLQDINRDNAEALFPRLASLSA